MNILVVSENFSSGGLETQIKTYYENLPENSDMVFVFGNYSGEVSLGDAKIYTDFHFAWDNTAKEFCDDVNRLVEIIKNEKIDVIHVHPYHAIFACLFASQIAKVKLVYSYHGISSFNFTKAPNTAAMFYYAFQSEAVGKVFSVSESGMKSFSDIGYSNTVFLPNPINLQKFQQSTYCPNNKWALISRLNEDKVGEIKSLLLSKDKYNLGNIDVYGSGDSEEELKSFIEQNGLSDSVKLKGYTNDVCNTVNGKYNGIIGIGRAILEGITMGVPVFLIGYNKVSGFVNKELYESLITRNFSNQLINETNFIMPSNEEILQLQSDARQSFGAASLTKKYLSELESTSNIFYENLCKLYYAIENISKEEGLQDCLIHKDRRVYNLLQNYIGRFSVSAHIDALFTNTNASYEVYDLMYKEFYAINENLQQLNAKTTNIFVKLFRRVKSKCGKNSRS